MKFVLRFIDSIMILAVDNEDETLSASVVMPPERSDFVLPSDVPDIEFHILVCYRFNVESNYIDQASLVLYTRLHSKGAHYL